MKTIPHEATLQNTALVGKTGSGKSSTAGIIVEQVAAEGSRVCILDPLKSDWWGLTSSADGNKPGLPFSILGGPRGHVPLHAAAGKAIGEVVASGALPLSILDMADFEPGGQAKFFNDFAPVLLRRMRGVLYLVIEEAHLFAPKERSGIGAENMMIHWAKTMATAGRSKGIRLILITQRTQALHNALLGSCDTLIAHRLTAPADQEPVLKWLKSNVTPDVAKQVASSLSSLKTGEGWLCSGEARIFERIQFPRKKTYDSSATPTDDDHRHEVKTAPVDLDGLRSIVGDAVKEAEAKDPKRLQARIAELERQVVQEQRKAAGAAQTGRSDAEVQAAQQEGYNAGLIEGRRQVLVTGPILPTLLETSMALRALHDALDKQVPLAVAPLPRLQPRPAPPIRASSPIARSDGTALSKAERRILTALAQYPDGRTKKQVATLTVYAGNGGGFNNALSALRSKGMIEGSGSMRILDAGLSALGPYEPLPTGAALLHHWLGQLGKAERAILQALVDAPRGLDKEALGRATGYEPNGGGFNNALSRLRTLELIEGRGELTASGELFS